METSVFPIAIYCVKRVGVRGMKKGRVWGEGVEGVSTFPFRTACKRWERGSTMPAKMHGPK